MDEAAVANLTAALARARGWNDKSVVVSGAERVCVVNEAELVHHAGTLERILVLQHTKTKTGETEATPTETDNPLTRFSEENASEEELAETADALIKLTDSSIDAALTPLWLLILACVHWTSAGYWWFHGWEPGLDPNIALTMKVWGTLFLGMPIVNLLVLQAERQLDNEESGRPRDGDEGPSFTIKFLQQNWVSPEVVGEASALAGKILRQALATTLFPLPFFVGQILILWNDVRLDGWISVVVATVSLPFAQLIGATQGYRSTLMSLILRDRATQIARSLERTNARDVDFDKTVVALNELNEILANAQNIQRPQLLANLYFFVIGLPFCCLVIALGPRPTNPDHWYNTML
jgi:hypothetical protein